MAAERSPRVLLAVCVTVLLWASAFVVIRGAVGHFGAGGLALGRLVVGSLALLGVVCVRREGLPPRVAWPGIVVSGVAWFGGYMVCLNAGEQRVDAGTAALVVNIGPILTALLAGRLLRDGFPPRLMAGVAVGFAGTALVGLSSGHGGSLEGVLLCMAAALGSAIGMVAQKPALDHATPLQATAFGNLIGAVACLPFATSLGHGLVTADVSDLIAIAYLGLFPTAIAFTTWAYALSHSTAGKMGATTYVVPALVVAGGWLIFGEFPSVLAIVGGIVCLAGVAVTRHTRPDGATNEVVTPAHSRQ